MVIFLYYKDTILIEKLSRMRYQGRLPLFFANGTAVGAVCVTGEAIRLVVPVVSKERVPVASRYGAVFAIKVGEGSITIAVQGDSY
jgi:hypothetical protein